MPVISDSVFVQRSNAFCSLASFSEEPPCGAAANGDDSVGFGTCVVVVVGCDGSSCVCVVGAMVNSAVLCASARAVGW